MDDQKHKDNRALSKPTPLVDGSDEQQNALTLKSTPDVTNEVEPASCNKSTSCKNSGDTAKKKTQAKGWFSHTFFLATVVLAMGLAYLNTWIGPDAPFNAGEYLKEDPEHQQAMITKLEMRLRRAELFQNQDTLFKARVNLSDAMFHLVKTDRALSLLRSAADSIIDPAPNNITYQILLSHYDRTHRYKEAAGLVAQWEKRMPTVYLLEPDIQWFYMNAAKASANDHNRSEARRYKDMSQRLTFLPRKYWQRPTNDRLTKPLPAAGPEFCAGCNEIVAGKFEDARNRFKSLSKWAPDQETTITDPTDKDDRVKSLIMLAAVSLHLNEITPEDELFRLARTLSEQLDERASLRMQMVLDRVYFDYLGNHPDERFYRRD